MITEKGFSKMSKRVRKAVFPAGGLGTRFLPATKVIPKEMLALVDKPILQYGVEEALASGIEHIIIVTGRGKGAMEDHFDISYELDATLERKGKMELLELSRSISSMARISYVRQKEPLGLGHAVLCAKELVGDEPFAVLLPDDVIDADPPCLKQMIDVFDERGGSVLATMTIEGPGISAYGVLAGEQDATNPRIYNCAGMVEKPRFEDAPSKQAIIGRYVLTPRVFELLEKTKPGAGGEIQLTDGIKALLKEEKVFGYTFEGKRFDASALPVTIDQSGCWFHPRVLGIQAGQPFEVVNSDPVTHNIHPMAQINREWNHSQGAGDPPLQRRFLKPEIMVPVKCNIHSWMHAYIGVVDNPYYAVSDRNGAFSIGNLPPGTYTVGVWQESRGTQEQQVTVTPQAKTQLNIVFKGK